MPRNARPVLLALINTIVLLSLLSQVSVGASAARDTSSPATIPARIPDSKAPRVLPHVAARFEAAPLYVAYRTTAAAAPQPAPAAKKDQDPALAEPALKPVAVPRKDVYWGVSMEGVPWDMNKLASWEDKVAGKGVSIVHFWQFWLQDARQGLAPFAPGPLDNVRGHGSIPMVTWAPEKMGGGTEQADFQLARIIGGEYDDYIRQWASDAKAWTHPFFLRWGHEMNGNWFAWSEDANGNRRGQFAAAWRHVHDIFNSVGATNISWVWCPNVDAGHADAPSLASLYPGDKYVDWTCLDGYNYGSEDQGGWKSFEKLYRAAYNELTHLATSKPLMIGEMGSSENAGTGTATAAPAPRSKAEWIRDALLGHGAVDFPDIKARVWYNWQFDGKDWRIESSQSSADALRTAVAAPNYLANRFGGLEVSPIPQP